MPPSGESSTARVSRRGRGRIFPLIFPHHRVSNTNKPAKCSHSRSSETLHTWTIWKLFLSVWVQHYTDSIVCKIWIYNRSVSKAVDELISGYVSACIMYTCTPYALTAVYCTPFKSNHQKSSFCFPLPMKSNLSKKLYLWATYLTVWRVGVFFSP